MANYVYINDMGEIWRFSQRNYAKWMLAFAEGKNPSPRSFRGKSICYARSVRDLKPEQANQDLRADKATFDLLKPKELRALDAVQYAEGGEVLEAGGETREQFVARIKREAAEEISGLASRGHLDVDDE